MNLRETLAVGRHRALYREWMFGDHDGRPGRRVALLEARRRSWRSMIRRFGLERSMTLVLPIYNLGPRARRP